MKKIIFSVMLLCSSTIGFAQLLDVTSTEKVNLPEGTVADIVTLSPKGDYMLLSDQKKQGLQKFDFRTGEIKRPPAEQSRSQRAHVGALHIRDPGIRRKLRRKLPVPDIYAHALRRPARQQAIRKSAG